MALIWHPSVLLQCRKFTVRLNELMTYFIRSQAKLQPAANFTEKTSRPECREQKLWTESSSFHYKDSAAAGDSTNSILTAAVTPGRRGRISLFSHRERHEHQTRPLRPAGSETKDLSQTAMAKLKVNIWGGSTWRQGVVFVWCQCVWVTATVRPVRPAANKLTTAGHAFMHVSLRSYSVLISWYRFPRTHMTTRRQCSLIFQEQSGSMRVVRNGNREKKQSISFCPTASQPWASLKASLNQGGQRSLCGNTGGWERSRHQQWLSQSLNNEEVRRQRDDFGSGDISNQQYMVQILLLNAATQHAVGTLWCCLSLLLENLQWSVTALVSAGLGLRAQTRIFLLRLGPA